MRKRTGMVNWVNLLSKSLQRSARRGRVARRFIQLEKLESRYVLTAPTVVDDNYFPNYHAVPESSGPLFVTQNDTFSFPSLIKITKVNEGLVNTPVGVSVDYPLAHGTLTLSTDHTFVSFTPNAAFTGVQTFTYRLSEGAEESTTFATVKIDVHPVTRIGSDVITSIEEGSGLHLDDLNSDNSPGSAGPGLLTYNWYIDTLTNPAGLDFSTYVPATSPIDSAGGNAVDHSVPALDLSWQDLNDLGIFDGLPQDAILSLAVTDGNGQTELASAQLSVANGFPNFLSFTMTPNITGCGTEYVLNATFMGNNNPLDDTYEVAVDWDDADFTIDPTLDPRAVSIGPVTDNHDGTFSVTATHAYDVAGLKLPFVFLTIRNSHTGLSDPPAFDLILDGPDAPFINAEAGGDGDMPAADDVGTAAEGSPVTINVLANDGSPTEIPTHVTIATQGLSGTAVVNPDLTVTYTPGDVDGPASDSFTYTVSDDDGCSATATVNVSISNTPPTASVSGPSAGIPLSPLSFNLSATDPSSVDQAAGFTYSVDWGDGSPVQATTASPAHAYASVGNYTVSVTATDKDNGTSTTATLGVSIVYALMQGNNLLVGGTSAADNISINPVAGGQVQAIMNGQSAGTFTVPGQVNVVNLSAATDSLTVAGTSGDDIIHKTSGTVTLGSPVVETVTYGSGFSLIIDAGAGNDTITDPGANTTILGGPGNDTIIITATSGNGVILDGGSGSDTYVIGGTTSSLAGPVTITDTGATGTDSVSIVGTSGDDTITQSPTGFSLNGAPIIVSGGVDSATINGGGGSDQVVVSGRPPVPVQVQAVSDMVINGGSGNDTISFTPGSTAGQIVGKLNGVVVSQFSPSGKLIGHGGDGNDDLQVAGSVGLAAWLYGGAGDDRLKGAAGSDVLLGEAGSDLLVGGSGRDLLIGGTGQDRLVGDADDDILIAGSTDYDGDANSLSAIMAIWRNTSNSFFTRASQLSTVLQNDGPNATVHDDDNKDMLTGSAGTDWYFANVFLDCGDDANTRDQITDLSLLELLFLQDIDFIEGP